MSATRIPVLMYHRAGDACNSWEARYAIEPRNFANHMLALARNGHRAVSIGAFVRWLDGGDHLPDRSLLLTFDDGFRSVGEHAWPVLRELGWPFTVFLVADLVGGRDEWTREANPSGTTHPLLGVKEICAMQDAGVSFGSHTRSHASLPELDDARLAEELAGSRAILERMLDASVDYLAYPFGHTDARVEAAARAAGYRAGFCTQPGFNRRDTDRFRIRRLDVFGTDTPGMLMRKIRLGTNDGTFSNTARYYLGRATARISGLVR